MNRFTIVMVLTVALCGVGIETPAEAQQPVRASHVTCPYQGRSLQTNICTIISCATIRFSVGNVPVATKNAKTKAKGPQRCWGPLPVDS